MINLNRAAIAAAMCVALPGVASAASSSAIATGLAIPNSPSTALASTATTLAIPAGQGRAFEIPARGRAIIVDAASARLYMLEDGQVRDSMRVIVGKPQAATPMLASTIHYATLNPYWNVPADLAQKIIAPLVLKFGLGYLDDRGYEVVDRFGPDARILPAKDVNWRKVAAGTETVFLRERPSPHNSMGEIKFGFANDSGIYLHDTPKKELFSEASRQLSNGCVRLEDAPRLARWMLGRDPQVSSDEPEQYVALPRGVPIVITYLDQETPTQIASLGN